MARSRAGRLHADVGNVTRPMRSRRCYSGRSAVNYEKDVVSVSRLVDHSVVPGRDHRRISTSRRVPELIAYAKKNPGKVRYTTRRRRQLPALRHGLLRQAGRRLEMIAIPNKTGAVRHDQRHGHRRHPGLVPQFASTAAQIKAGKLRPLAVVGHQRLPEFPDVPTMAGDRLSRCRHDRTGRACSRRPARRRRCWTTIFKASSRPARRRRCSRRLREAEFQHRAEQVARRCQGLARRRDQDLEGHHLAGEGRSRGIASPRPLVRPWTMLGAQ